MATQGFQPVSSKSGWPAMHVYAMAIVCLVVGVAIGYLARGTAGKPPATVAIPTGNAGAAPPPQGSEQMPSLAQMKQMADKKAEPLLSKLKADPNNPATLEQLGDIYDATHQFKDAAGYYLKALAIDPGNVPVRTRMASCLYFTGQADAAILQLEQSLQYDPKHAGTLFNLGMIRWKGKGDARGAVAAWQKLLDLYPKLPGDLPDRQAVEKLITEAKSHSNLKG